MYMIVRERAGAKKRLMWVDEEGREGRSVQKEHMGGGAGREREGGKKTRREGGREGGRERGREDVPRRGHGNSEAVHYVLHPLPTQLSVHPGLQELVTGKGFHAC